MIDEFHKYVHTVLLSKAYTMALRSGLQALPASLPATLALQVRKIVGNEARSGSEVAVLSV